jgi:hypothetical protein
MLERLTQGETDISSRNFIELDIEKLELLWVENQNVFVENLAVRVS